MAEITVVDEREARTPFWRHRGFRLSWGAVFAGLIVATVLQLALSLLGFALNFLGWSAGDPLASLGIGTLVWLIATAIITLFIGGLITGHLARFHSRRDRALHGLVLWGLSTLMASWLIWKAFSFIMGGAVNLAGGALSTTAGALASGVAQAGGAAAEQVGGLDLGAIEGEIETALQQTENPALQPDSLGARAEQVRAAASSPQSNQSLAAEIAEQIRSTAGQARREDLVNLTVARTGLSEAEAERMIDRIESLAGTAQAQVGTTVDTVGAAAARMTREGAEQVMGALSRASWLALLAMLLSGAAAVWAAVLTAKEGAGPDMEPAPVSH